MNTIQRRAPRSRGGAVAAVLLSLATLLLVPAVAYGHGYSTNPTSRAVWCQKGQAGDCGGVQWEPQSIEGPKGFPTGGPPAKKVCSAGNSRWKALDGVRAPNGNPWPRTTVQADTDYTVIWYLTAPHKTTNFRVFLTREDWEVGDPITRSTIDPTPIADKDWGGSTPGRDVEFDIHWPDRSGPVGALLVWDIADTSMAFYQCADLYFAN